MITIDGWKRIRKMIKMKVKIKMIVETSRIESEGDLKRNIVNKIERTGDYRVEFVGVNKIE